MDSKWFTTDYRMIAFVAVAACTAFLLGDLPRAIFVALAASSVWLFLYTVHRRLISVFPKHGDLPHDNLPKRLWRLLVEVPLQYRVVRARPVVGVLHALVLWGFVAFAGASAEHLRWGLRGLGQATKTESWYGAFVAVWAVAVLVAMIGLSFRRFVLRPKPLGKASVTSGIVAFLISALMVTYVLGWRAFPVGSLTWKINWWTHTAAFFSLLVVIPLSKHLHLVLAPFTVFLRTETTSAMRALREDGDDLGMIHFPDLGRKDVLDVNACVECGRCTDFCPANRAGGSLSPKEIILDLQKGLLRGARLISGTAAEKAQGTVFIAEEDLFQCFTCGACEYVCPLGIEHVGRKILDLRRGLVSEGRVTNDKVNRLFTTMERAPHNPWGISHETRQRLIESKRFPIFDGSQEWLFWLGCGLSYDQHGQAVAQAMRQILDAADVSWGVLPRETCCGEPARRAGNEYLFLELSQKLIEAFEGRRVRNIVSCCPHCTTMFDRDYRQITSYAKLNVKVVHHSKLIAELLPRLPIKPSLARATYHDPCYLARGLAITAAPRKILRACGVSVAEARHHGQNTQCCGAGGAQLFLADDQRNQGKERVNQLRFAQLTATKESAVAVACPHCHTMLRDAANLLSRDDVEILDLAEICAQRLPGKSEGNASRS
jgi:Fe-S oxidoreductase